jgi:hypothetical protein
LPIARKVHTNVERWYASLRARTTMRQVIGGTLS